MQLYQHYLGELFAVIFLEPVEVKIMNFTENHLLERIEFLRPDKFHENVEYQGKTGPRFRLIADPADVMSQAGHP